MNSDPGIVQTVALVTSGGRGLGRVLAGFSAKQGCGLIVMARNGPELQAAAKEFATAGVPVVPIPGNVSVPSDRLRLLAAAKRHGRIDLLVNNASDLGDTPLPPLVNASRDTFLRVFDVNTLAPLAIVREALPLLTRVRGLVVNITSDAALGGYPGWGVYGARKPSLGLVSQRLATER